MHGDYDVDGMCASAVLVRVLRTLGADVDWYLPSRIDDGYGLAAATVERLAARGTDLLVTVDCAITAVEEVAQARAAGLDVVVTDHHAPRADGRLPDAPIVHPRIGGYPCTDLCAAAVAYKLAQALLAAAGEDPGMADEDLDLVALATVADVVPLLGENRRLVRAGLRALASTRKPGLRALMDVARVDPSTLDASAIGFRLGPRLNAAGRLYRADAGLELLLTEDRDRARAVAAELDAVNAERRDVETRIRFEAEKQVAEQGSGGRLRARRRGLAPGRDRDRRRPRRRAPPPPRGADRAARGGGHGLGALDPRLRPARRPARPPPGTCCATAATAPPPASRSSAGQIDAFRESFAAHAAGVLTPEDLRPEVRVDAVVPGNALTLGLAEELDRLAPFGQGNRPVSLLVPAALLDDAKPLAEGRHVAFTLAAGGARSRCVLFGAGSRLPAEPREPVGAVVRLEANQWNGTVEPRLILRHVQRAAQRPIELVGELAFAAALLGELDRDLAGSDAGSRPPARPVLDRRGHGIAGLLADLVATGEPVLAVAAHAPHRARALRDRVGGFALTSWSRPGGRSRPRRGVRARRRHRPAQPRPARPCVRRGLDPPGLG